MYTHYKGWGGVPTVTAKPTGERDWLDDVTLYALRPESGVRCVRQLHLLGDGFEREDSNHFHHPSPGYYMHVHIYTFLSSKIILSRDSFEPI